MKTTLIIGGALLLVAAGIQAAVTVSTNKTEHRPYRVIETEGDFEIRYYPPCNMASVRKPGSVREMSNNGFRDLAGYIFGGNKSGKSIAMTSPVLMETEGDTTEMSFVMPAEYGMEELPDPNNANVQLKEVPASYAATLRFGGFANDKEIREKKEALMKWVSEKALETKGNYIYMGYNPPYQLVDRRNEVMVEIDYLEN